MATIEDVAKQAGVSVTTVSRALNGHPYVSDKTKELIFDTMKVMNYTPNIIAQQLRGKKTKMIGVIISRVTNPFFAYLVDAIEQIAFQKGYQVVILQTSEDSARELNFLKLLDAKQIDGLIMTNTENDYRTLKKYIENNQLVICNRYIYEDEMPVIRINEEKAAYEGVIHLLEKGYRKIGYCTGYEIHPYDYRLDGYKKALKEYEIPFENDLIFTNILSIEDGKNLIKQWDSLKIQPDAIFSNGDEVGAGLISQANEQKIEVPNELAVIGFDDQPLASLTFPKMTTIHQPIDELGAYAAELLISKLEKAAEPKLRDFTTEVIVRQST
ncbi:LacI family DNA-binding transcriptional regulator [Vagococcus sp.]|uniref:LacI family DNA-binding transcriptional regulator n=1 Tax=Vagococcus sp. TaxID=1933889 RepID=UPI003F9CAFF1